MGKTILVYCWNSVCEPMTIRAMKELGYEVYTLNVEMKDYHADAAFAQKFITALHSQKADIVFSYDYFPLISMICQMNQIPYASWIYDCPQYTLLSKTVFNSCNYIFCFDEEYTRRFQKIGVENICHFPLAADVERYDKVKNGKESAYACDVSFVGGLYNDGKNRIAAAGLDEYTAGYVQGLIRSQLNIYGYNLIADSLTDEIANEIVEKCYLSLGENYYYDKVQMAADAIGMEVTSRERMEVLDRLTDSFDVTLYSNSQLPECLSGKERLVCKGTVDYSTQMPLVFQNSKINLNITSKTIETGIPQRVMDILACGGFCLTNYQKEIAEQFIDGEELVMYTSMDDLVQKVQYYLENEEEREHIARNGYKKVCESFGINARIQELLYAVEGDL